MTKNFKVGSLVLCALLAMALWTPDYALARKKQTRAKKEQLPVSQKGGLTPAAPAARPFAFTPGTAWVTGKVTLDSGYAKAIELNVPTLTNTGAKQLAYVSDTNGTFSFEADLSCPTTAYMTYGSGFWQVYLEPGDTLHVTLDSRDCREGMSRECPSLRFSGPNGDVAQALADFSTYRKGAGYMYPFQAKTTAAFKAGIDSLDKVYHAELEAFADSAKITTKAYDILSRYITSSMSGYTWYAWINKMTPDAEVMSDLFAGGYPIDDDRNFVNLNQYLYYLGQCAYMPALLSETRVSRGQGYRETLDSLAIRYPKPGLSRDAMYLILLQRAHYFAADSALTGIFENPGQYIQDPFILTSFNDWVAGQKQQAAAAEGGSKRNAYNFDLKPAEEFIGALFAPYKGTGKVLYVDVWGVWCGPCRREMPASVELHKALEGKPVEFIYLCVDSSVKDWEKSKTDLGIADTGHHIFLNKDQSTILMNYFGFSGIPAYWIIDKDGRFVREDAPRPSYDQTRPMLEELAGK